MEEPLLPVSTAHGSSSKRDKNAVDSEGVGFGERLNKQLQDLKPPRTQACICRVHKGLRNVNKEAYTPMLISIGPYHYGDPKLAAMQYHKLRYLHSFLNRTGKTLESCLHRVDSLFERALGCYAEDRAINITTGKDRRNKLVEMMLLDACFMIEFLLRLREHWGVDKDVNKDDPIFKSSWMRNQICRDLILVENQIPFFLLSNLLHEREDDRVSLREVAKSMAAEMLLDPPSPPHGFVEQMKKVIRDIFKCCFDHEEDDRVSLREEAVQEVGKSMCAEMLLDPPSSPHGRVEQMKKVFCVIINCHDEPKHFLDLLWKNCVQTKNTASPEENLNAAFKKILHEFDSNYKTSPSTSTPCVRELLDAGIKFKINRRKGGKLFDIEYDGGHTLRSALLKIPRLKVRYHTETLFRNMIAYEQNYVGKNDMYFSNYVHFMNQLINEEEDARHLRFRDIINSQLGDDKEVATLINKLCQGVLLLSESPTDYRYAEVCRGVNAHRQKKWNQMMAIIRRNYLNNPWAVVTTCVALLLFVITTVPPVLSLINSFALFH